jgi:hypothetical protein
MKELRAPEIAISGALRGLVRLAPSRSSRLRVLAR